MLTHANYVLLKNWKNCDKISIVVLLSRIKDSLINRLDDFRSAISFYSY